MGDNNIFIGVWPGEKFPLPWWSVPPSFCAHLPSRSPHPLAGLTSLTWKNLPFSFTKIPCSPLKQASGQYISSKTAAIKRLWRRLVSSFSTLTSPILIFRANLARNPDLYFFMAHLKSPLCVVMDMSRNMIFEQDLVERLDHRIVIFEPVRVKRWLSNKVLS